MPYRRFILAAPLGLVACSSLLPRQKYVPRTIWPLQPPPSGNGATMSTGPVLLVRGITAGPGLERRGLQSLLTGGDLKIDYYNLWAVPPADAVTQGLVSWAQASGLFSAVVTPGTRLTPGLIVEGELTELLTDIPARQARAAMSLLVIKPAGNLGGFAQPLGQVKLTAAQPVHGTGAAAQAAAQTQAVASLLAQAMARLAGYASR
ncbi:ABC-type transport auxiliary lipoprotein family protein [Acidocella sp.]|uniref:ABC-type transport auxiliary lipoprotein family protein n=1 Tax=Acidocella sp. TaxID=50710 RepID=UPI003CFEF834